MSAIMLRPLVRSAHLRVSLSKRLYATNSRVGLACDLHPAFGTNRSNEPAPPILFMHGLFGSKKNNRSISKVLARDLKRDVYTLDLRNHGDAAHSPRHDYLAMADDVVGFMEQNQLKNPTLIGHSMGAKVAMTLALQSPELVKDFVSVDNAPIDATLGGYFGKYIRGMKKIEESNVTRQSEADKILQEYEKDFSIRQFLLGNMYRPEGESTYKFRVPLTTLGNSLDHLGDFPFKNPDAVRFEKPALFVRGTKSHYVPDEALPIIGRFFPRFELADIDAGHWVISEQPEAFRKAVVDFLKPKE